MKQPKKLSIWYDKEGDFLEIIYKPCSDAIFREFKKDHMQIIDRKTGNIIGYAVFNFTYHKRKEKFIDLELPLPQSL